MDLETKIGQLFIYVMRDAPERVGHQERDFLRRFRPGGLIVYRNNIRRREQIARYLAELQGLAYELGLPGPLIVCVDHRGGDSSILAPEHGGLEFPAPLAQSALGELAESAGEEIGAAIARDVLDVGFNLNLAPYADFLERGDIQRFVFGNSMMGADPQVNAALSVGLIRGMQREGLRTTYCVFPGGYGSLDRDPHHFAGVIAADRRELEERFLVAPRAALAAGADAVMLSHFQFPALDPQSRPATFSEPVIRGVLREEMGFQGLVMTDAIGMRGAVEVAGSRGEAAVRALQAGADAILCANWEDRLAVSEAVRSGRLSEARLDEALEKVLALKAKLAWQVPGQRREPDPSDAGRMAAWIERSLTWVRRPDGWQPLGAEPGGAGGRPRRPVAVARWRHFLDAAGQVGGPGVATVWLPPRGELETEPGPGELDLLERFTQAGDVVLFGTSSVADLQLARQLQQAGREVWVAHAGRVFQVEHGPDLPGLLLAYSHGPLASRKALEVFWGLAEARGRIPVPLAR